MSEGDEVSVCVCVSERECLSERVSARATK